MRAVLGRGLSWVKAVLGRGLSWVSVVLGVGCPVFFFCTLSKKIWPN